MHSKSSLQLQAFASLEKSCHASLSNHAFSAIETKKSPRKKGMQYFNWEINWIFHEDAKSSPFPLSYELHLKNTIATNELSAMCIVDLAFSPLCLGCYLLEENSFIYLFICQLNFFILSTYFIINKIMILG